MVMVLSPSPVVATTDRSPSRPAGPLRGRRVGLRRDKFWVSWDHVTDEWARMLAEDGAEVVIWRAPIGKGDKEMVEGGEEYEKFLDEIDVAVVGLANCGSCTIWAVHDAAGALDRDLPTVIVCTTQFEPLVRVLAEQRGHTDPRLALMPYPLEGKPEEEVRAIARERYSEMLGALGAVRS